MTLKRPAGYEIADLAVTWGDLREVPIATLRVGSTLLRLDFRAPYHYGADGRMQGLTFTPQGSVWTLTARDGDTYTVERRDGKRSQTFTASPRLKVVAVTQG